MLYRYLLLGAFTQMDIYCVLYKNNKSRIKRVRMDVLIKPLVFIISTIRY